MCIIKYPLTQRAVTVPSLSYKNGNFPTWTVLISNVTQINKSRTLWTKDLPT